jgi:hypothetical protein
LTDDERIRQAEAELWALKKRVRKSRKDAHKTDGKLAAAFVEAMHILDAQKANGVPFAERIQGLDETLRHVWPFTRTWHYLCEACRDTGLVMHVCRLGARCDGISSRIDGPKGTPGKYKRLCAQHPTSDYTHEYGIPCDCEKGRRFREPATRRGPDDFKDAGKSKPTRIGR